LFACIKLNENHNQTLDTAATLRFLPADQTIQLKFEELFSDEMSLTEAVKHHKKPLELEDNFSLKYLAYGFKNPTYRTVQNWHDKWKLKNLGPRTCQALFKVLIYVIYLLQISRVGQVTLFIITVTRHTGGGGVRTGRGCCAQ
jgi:hypothetical protein